MSDFITHVGVTGSTLAPLKTQFDIVNSYLETAPVNLDGIARDLGIEVDMDAAFTDGASGCIFRDGNKYKIQVNASHSIARKRFTLAHEIAHFLLHKDKIGSGIKDNALYRSGLDDYIEYEANRYAAEITMPAKLMRNLYRSGIVSLPQLKEAFIVSEEALRIRLKQLRLGV